MANIPGDCTSLIVVLDSNLEFLIKEENDWKTIMKTKCYYGKNGYSSSRKSGDMTTPVGLFKILYGFGTNANINTQIPYKLITNNSYFCDDENSEKYNSWVESSTPIIGEHLIDYPKAYEYGVVFDFNMNPKVKGKGSSIFLHCFGNNNYTMGCIAISKEDLKTILEYLTPNAYIQILEKEDN